LDNQLHTSQYQALNGRVQHLVNQLAAAGSDEFFDILTKEIAQTLNVKYCYASQYLDAERSRARVLSFWNGEGYGPKVEYDTAGTPCGEVSHRAVTFFPSGIKTLFPEDAHLDILDVESYLAVPFTDLEGVPLGHVCIMDNEPMEEDMFNGAVLTIISMRSTAEVQRLNYENHLLQIALQDPLTGLLNRTIVWDRLEHAVNRSFRSDVIVGVVFVDFDEFKTVNDSYGHEAGDYVLINAADAIRSTIRKTDSACRFGGDEFLVILEDAVDSQSAIAVAQEIHNSLNEAIYELKEGNITLSASVGVALCPDHSKDPKELVHLADSAMYQAKQGDEGFVVYSCGD
jgi:diguanylate cyclase (GGDEF)-like protein